MTVVIMALCPLMSSRLPQTKILCFACAVFIHCLHFRIQLKHWMGCTLITPNTISVFDDIRKSKSIVNLISMFFGRVTF